MLADLEARTLTTGQPVARILDPDLTTRLSALMADIRLQDNRVRILKDQEGKLEKIYASYADIARAIARQRDAEVSAAEAIEEERRLRLQRLTPLHRQGLVTAAVFEEARSSLLQARAATTQARAARQEAATNQSLAARDVLFTGSRVEGGSLQELHREIATATAEATSLRERLTALQSQENGQILTSPCTCVIGRVRATPGSWVRAGDPVLDLHREGKQDVLVEARISQTDADRLFIEGPVQVLLPNTTTPVMGRVSLVQRTPLSDTRTGLSDVLPDAEARTLATVLVRLLAPLPAASGEQVAGLPVQVRFDLRPHGLAGDILRAVYR
jgi:multidrug resistance efflux pump